MKSYLILFILIFTAVHKLSAQDNTDKIYLKNGTIIRGMVIDQIPEKTVSVLQKTANGKDSIYIYKAENVIMIVKADTVSQRLTLRDSLSIRRERKEAEGLAGSIPVTVNNTQLKQNEDMSISEKIQEEMKQTRIQQPAIQETPLIIEQSSKNFTTGNKTGDPEESFDPFSSVPPRRKQIKWNREISGFRAFFDQTLTLGVGKIPNHRWGSSTSLGVQFNPIFYTGIGISYDMTLNNKEGAVPIFINPRINFLDENITPFLDIRTGWSFLEGKGFYASPTVGVSFAKGVNAYNVGIGYSFQRAKYKYRPDKSYIETIPVINNFHGIFIKFTFEFNLYRF